MSATRGILRGETCSRLRASRRSQAKKSQPIQMLADQSSGALLPIGPLLLAIILGLPLPLSPTAGVRLEVQPHGGHDRLRAPLWLTLLLASIHPFRLSAMT